jgi:hypothetical protein
VGEVIGIEPLQFAGAERLHVLLASVEQLAQYARDGIQFGRLLLFARFHAPDELVFFIERQTFERAVRLAQRVRRLIGAPGQFRVTVADYQAEGLRLWIADLRGENFENVVGGVDEAAGCVADRRRDVFGSELASAERKQFGRDAAAPRIAGF